MNVVPLRVAVLSGVVSSIALLACSSGAGGSIGGAPVAFDQLGKTYLEKVCAAIKPCCTENGFAEEFATCAQGASTLQAAFDEEKAKSPELVYDAQKAGNCIAKIASVLGTCDPKHSTVDVDHDPDCVGMLRGTKALGATCTSSEQCALGSARTQCVGASTVSDSQGHTTSEEGICIALKAVPGEGDPCFTYDEVPKADVVYASCESSDTFYCDRTTHTCKARGGPGASCEDKQGDFTSYSEQYCNKDSRCDAETRQCVARKAVGEACESSHSDCAATAYCDPTTNKCAALKAGGEACDDPQAPSAACLHGCDSQTKKCRVNGVARDTCSGDLD
jgi:hypothetical protein